MGMVNLNSLVTLIRKGAIGFMKVSLVKLITSFQVLQITVGLILASLHGSRIMKVNEELSFLI